MPIRELALLVIDPPRDAPKSDAKFYGPLIGLDPVDTFLSFPLIYVLSLFAFALLEVSGYQ